MRWNLIYSELDDAFERNRFCFFVMYISVLVGLVCFEIGSLTWEDSVRQSHTFSFVIFECTTHWTAENSKKTHLKAFDNWYKPRYRPPTPTKLRPWWIRVAVEPKRPLLERTASDAAPIAAAHHLAVAAAAEQRPIYRSPTPASRRHSSFRRLQRSTTDPGHVVLDPRPRP